MKSHTEHRQHPRHRVEYKCIFSSDGIRIDDGIVADLSLGGCRIKTAQPLAVGTSMELQIRPEQHTFVYVPHAVVRWVEGATFGVDFTELPELEAATLTRLLWGLPP